MSYRIGLPVLASIVWFCSPLSGQVILTRDVRPYRSVVTHLIADQTINAKKYVIDYYGVGAFTPEGLAQQAAYSASRSAILQDLATETGLAGSDIMTALGPVLAGIGAVSLAYNVAQAYAEYNNTQSRLYQFYLPVSGIYKFTCSMVGDIDYPRNKVQIIGPRGTIFNYSREYWSSTTENFYVSAQQGSYVLAVSLGSGSSSVFHTAGTLNGVMLDDYSYHTWTAPVVVAGSRGALPGWVGATQTYQVTFPGYPSIPSLLDGSVSYANLRPAAAACLATLDGTPMGEVRAVNKPIHYISPVISTIGQPAFNGSMATFTVQRMADYEEDLYPDDWYDQDGDGIPDPPM